MLHWKRTLTTGEWKREKGFVDTTGSVEAGDKISVTAPACNGQIYGKGLEGYLMAIDSVIALIK